MELRNRPKEMDAIRRAYQLWQLAGEPFGKDDEFYYQAKQMLQAEMSSADEGSGIEDRPNPDKSAYRTPARMSHAL